jgi:two-component system nitrogen regulation sensor histidine kinase GlnL
VIKQVLDSLSTAVVVFSSSLEVRYMNPSAEQLTASSKEKAQGLSVDQLLQRDESWRGELQKVLDTGAPITNRQVQMNFPNKSDLVVDYTVTPFLEEGETRLLVEIQSLDRLMRISREEALVSSQQTSRSLIRGFAHEIKNPLGGIRGAAQLLDRELDRKELQDFTQVIIEESDRLRDLVDRMLGSNKPLQKEFINIHEVLERVSSLVEAEAGDSIQIHKDYDPSIPEIRVDKDQLIQALLNIARNAMQALLESEIDNRKILLRTRVERYFTISQTIYPLVCRVDIVDNGPGIPEGIIQDIFYPMISGRADGTGLGLSISQSIVVQHDGLIECNRENQKTVFSVYLPLENDNDEY